MLSASIKELTMHPEFEKFLNPDNFITGFDSLTENIGFQQQQYDKGKSIGNLANEIHISISNTWSSVEPDGGITSYERIGVHACTAALLKGFLDSSAKVVVHRVIDGKVEKQTIKEARYVA